MATGYAKLAYESVPGNEGNTPTLSTKVLYPPALSVDLGAKTEHLGRGDEIRNLDEEPALVPEAFTAEHSIECRAYPDVTAFLFKWLLGPPTTTVGDGIITAPDGTTIPAGAYRHVWTSPFGPAGPYPQTADLVAAYKDQGVFYRAKGCGLSQLSIENAERGGVMIKASGPALFVARISDPSLTPTYESLGIRPWTSGNFTIPNWLSGSANCEKSGMSIEFANPMEPYTSCQVSSKWADQLEKTDTPISVTGNAPKRLIDIDDWDALMAATGFATLAQWISDSTIGVTGYPYKLFIETANSQYVDGGPEPLTNKRRLGAQFNWRATNASGSPGSVTVTIINATASYS